MVPSPGPTRPTDRAARCVMWAPAGHDAPAGLLDGLRQRGVAVREVSSAPEAMATIGLSGEGGEGAAVNVVVIVEPGAPLPGTDDLVEILSGLRAGDKVVTP